MQQDATPAAIFPQVSGSLPQNKHIAKLLLQVSHKMLAFPAPLPVEELSGVSTPHRSPGSAYCWGQDYTDFVSIKVVLATATSKAETVFTSPLSHLLCGHITKLQTYKTTPSTLTVHSMGDKHSSLFPWDGVQSWKIRAVRDLSLNN